MTRLTAQRGKLLAILGLMLSMFLVSLDQTVVGTAMPRIVADLSGFELYAWVTTAYLLAETAVLPIVGKLGDVYGRKWIAVAGVAIFLGTSWLCGISHSMLWLIGCRGVQGLGGGMVMTTAFTSVADVFPDLRERARYQGLMFSVFTVSSLIGPVLGGWITDALGWRWVFYVNVPVGITALATLPFVLPQNERQRGAGIDWRGALTATVGVVALLMPLEWVGAGRAWSSPEVIGGLLIAVLAFAAFVPIELRAASPMLPMDLFRNSTIAVTSLVLFLVGIVMFGVTLYVPLFVQGVLGRSASISGAVMMPMSITMTLMGILVGQLIARSGKIKPFLLFGAAGMSFGLFLLTTLQVGTTPLMVAGFLLTTAIGLGTVMPVTTLAVQMAVEPRMIGVATSATQFVRSIGSTMGTALIGTLVTGGYLGDLAAHTPAGVPAQAVSALHSPNALVDPAALQSLAGLMAEVQDGVRLMGSLLDAARAGLATAIQHGFIFMLGASLLSLLCALWLADLRIDTDVAAREIGAVD